MALDGNTIRPFIQPNAFIAPSASIIGSVVVNDKSMVMYGATIRGDLALIHIGAHCTIADNATLHAGAVDGSLSPSDAVATGLSIEPELYVGDYTFIGANASLNGCHLEGDNVVGHCARIDDGVRMGRYAVVHGGSWVEPGVEIGEGEIWQGSPARKVGIVDAEESAERRRQAILSEKMAQKHAYEFLPVGFNYLEKEALHTAQLQK